MNRSARFSRHQSCGSAPRRRPRTAKTSTDESSPKAYQRHGAREGARHDGDQALQGIPGDGHVLEPEGAAPQCHEVRLSVFVARRDVSHRADATREQPDPGCRTIGPMSPRARLLLLAALSGGALLVGVELMITAVALPSILQSLADWTQLRRASWIVNALPARLHRHHAAGRACRGSIRPAAAVHAGPGRCSRRDLRSRACPRHWTCSLRRASLQGIGGGAIVPLATAGASHLYDGPARSRALGIVGACTFLGMAIGPFAGATVLQLVRLLDGVRQRRPDQRPRGVGLLVPVMALDLLRGRPAGRGRAAVRLGGVTQLAVAGAPRRHRPGRRGPLHGGPGQRPARADLAAAIPGLRRAARGRPLYVAICVVISRSWRRPLPARARPVPGPARCSATGSSRARCWSAC